MSDEEVIYLIVRRDRAGGPRVDPGGERVSDIHIPEGRIERVRKAACEEYTFNAAMIRAVVTAAYEDLREYPEPVTDEQIRAICPSFSGPEDHPSLKAMILDWQTHYLFRAPDPDAPIKDLLLAGVERGDTCRACTSNLRVREAFKRGKESK